jgi:hypothetical protein
VPEQSPGGPAEDHLAQSGVPVGAHYDEVDVVIGDVGD